MCQNIFKTRSYSHPDQFRWKNYDFSNLDYLKYLKLTKCIMVGHFGPTKRFFQIHPIFFLNIAWNFLSGKVLFVIFWYQTSLEWFFEFWHTLFLAISASSIIDPNLKIYFLEKWFFFILGIFLDWPLWSYLSNGILSTL